MSPERKLLHDVFNYAENLPAKIHYDIIQLLAQPEQEPKIEFKGLRLNGDSYSKRESLSDEEIKETTKNMSEFGADMFKAGIKAAEKAHGIGVGDE